ncbi:hypothetical protein [Streptomyces sp. SID3343]|nr:hypothetical protein [Streptomyces sp. SID3343]MYW03056.1 hypothetical protein [Streptomyces sp. SID3343]MYW03904.1 hypothetical protein [Streptomyces sp. SID3343]
MTDVTDAQALQFPMVVIFGLIVFMLVRAGELRVWQVCVVGLFGFYLAQSSLAPSITALVGSLLGALFHTG